MCDRTGQSYTTRGGPFQPARPGIVRDAHPPGRPRDQGGEASRRARRAQRYAALSLPHVVARVGVELHTFGAPGEGAQPVPAGGVAPV